MKIGSACIQPEAAKQRADFRQRNFLYPSVCPAVLNDFGKQMKHSLSPSRNAERKQPDFVLYTKYITICIIDKTLGMERLYPMGRCAHRSQPE
jgi:hypothetical protein